MRKIEMIWQQILYSALYNKKVKFTQKELAEEFRYSLSTINYALEIPSKIGAIRKTARFFALEDFEKLLFYWASARRLYKDILYATYLPASVSKIEGFIPSGAIFACYSAGKRILLHPPADYSKVYFYLLEKDLDKTKERFPESKKEPNVFVLKMRPEMRRYGEITSLPQTFVDIWNLKDWYSKEFTRALIEKMYELLS